jgi:hypothetical protein
MRTPEQQAALDTLAERLKEWDQDGEGKFSATDFAVAARAVVAAFEGVVTPQPLHPRDVSLHQDGRGRVLFGGKSPEAVTTLEGLFSGSRWVRDEHDTPLLLTGLPPIRTVRLAPEE